MIINSIKFNASHKKHIGTFDGNHEHWNGTCAQRTTLRGAIRRHYLKEQEYVCAYCYRKRQDKHGYNWDIDHIIPKSTHPLYTYEPKNFAMSCKECNIAKDNKNVLDQGVNASGPYPNKQEDYLIIHPHFDNYEFNMCVHYTHKMQIYHTPNGKKGLETFSLCNLIRFTEEIAETSEVIKESQITLGFTDDTFNKYYEGFEKFTSFHTSNPDIKRRMYARHLAEAAGLDTEVLLAAIEAERIKQQNLPPSDQSFTTNTLPTRSTGQSEE